MGLEEIKSALNRAGEDIAQDCSLPEELKTKADCARFAATVITVIAVASAVVALAGGILSGGIIAGVIGFTACTLLAIVANDVHVIADKIRNGSWVQTTRLLASNNPIQEICANAAATGTVILTPDLIRWAFSILE